MENIMVGAQIDVWKKYQMGLIEIESAKIKEQQRADISSIREYQKLSIEVVLGEEVTVSKELFGGLRCDKSCFKILDYKNYICDGKIVISVMLKTPDCVRIVHFSLEKLDNLHINKKFNAAGISFGYSHEKETAARRLLLDELISKPRWQPIAPAHGWYMEGEQFAYAYPGDITWKELDPYV